MRSTRSSGTAPPPALALHCRPHRPLPSLVRGRPRSGARRRRRACSPPCSSRDGARRQRAYFRSNVMTDIRRTLLWVIFLALAVPASGTPGTGTTASRRSSGRPPVRQPPRRASPRGQRRRRPRSPAARRRAPAAATPAPAPRSRPLRGAGARAGEQVTVVDRSRPRHDRQHRRHPRPRRAAEAGRPARSVASTSCCSTARPAGSTSPQTGLVPPAGGAGLPNHHTPMTSLPGERSLGNGQNELEVAFEIDPVGGVKLVKTYTFKRGDYVIDVEHQIVNAVGRADAARSSTCSWCATATSRRAARASTSPSPARRSTPTARKLPQDRLQDDREARTGREADHETSGRTAGSRWCSTTSPSAWLVDKPGSARPRARVLHRQGRRQHCTRSAMMLPLGEHRARRRPRPSTRASSPARRKKNKLDQHRARPRAGQGLRLASRSSPSRCSGC